MMVYSPLQFSQVKNHIIHFIHISQLLVVQVLAIRNTGNKAYCLVVYMSRRVQRYKPGTAHLVE